MEPQLGLAVSCDIALPEADLLVGTPDASIKHAASDRQVVVDYPVVDDISIVADRKAVEVLMPCPQLLESPLVLLD